VAADAQAGSGLTARLVGRSLATRWDDLPPDVRRVARDCLADWLACTLAGLAEPASEIVVAQALDEGGHPQASFIGRAARGSLLQAALVNGTASHALDYDDVNLSVPGHLSVAILPAVLALAEHLDADVRSLLAAFVAGYEFACRVGCLVEPAHYANGFHATATIGGLGSAVACSHLLGLDLPQACEAVGLAATQAAGMKAMFGTMTKPLHAGLAAQGGLRAALLARRGLSSRADVLECHQGFAALHGRDFHVEPAQAAPAGGFHILANLFKFHAACYSTHSTIEAVARLRCATALPLPLPQPEVIHVTVGEGSSICNIASPTTALEAKFSLRAAAAFAWLGIDTSSLHTWGRVTDPEVVGVRDRVEVELVPGMGLSEAVVRIRMPDGQDVQCEHDCGVPPADKAEQSARVDAKFLALVGDVLGPPAAHAMLAELDREGPRRDVSALVGQCAHGA
jgi:2-methylcitrate dehydratase PrpD